MQGETLVQASKRTGIRARTPFRTCQIVVEAFTAAVLLFLLNGLPGLAQQSGEKTFSSPGAAVVGLYSAAKSNDDQALKELFGSHANDIIHTGDDVADNNMQANFITRYDQMHRVVIEPDQTATLYIGAENWPLPIPLVKNNNGMWYFNAEAGKQEILYRRVGTNENDAIDVLHARSILRGASCGRAFPSS
jgi:Protein of unknown function (DUF2950)